MKTNFFQWKKWFFAQKIPNKHTLYAKILCLVYLSLLFSINIQKKNWDALSLRQNMNNNFFSLTVLNFLNPDINHSFCHSFTCHPI